MSENEQPEPGPPPNEDAPPPIEDAPPPLASSPSVALVSGSKAEAKNRFIAILVDGIVGLGIFIVLGIVSRSLAGWLGYAAYMLVRDGLELDFMKQRSIGKQIMKLKVVRSGGGAMDLQTSLMRNWPLALSAIISAVLWLGGLKLWLALSWLASLAGLLGLVEAILVLVDPQARRIGDKFADTSVVNE